MSRASKRLPRPRISPSATSNRPDFPAIYVVNANKCFITTAEGSENTLSVTGEFRADGETNTDAVIYSKDDLVLNGLGTLTINSAAGNGISGKDDIKVTGGTYSVTCEKDAFEAKELIAVCGGSFDIKAKSDGIQGAPLVRIDGGEIKIDSSEGIEAAYIKITGGTIDITASDDGINASSGSAGSQSDFDRYDTEGICIEFTGGTTTINMAAGDTDGVDSNGALVISGGTISVNTQGNAFDYDTEPVFTGGTILINGEEQSEVPEDMMGGFGGGRGGFGGKRPDGFDGKMPEGFEPPEGFDGQMPEGFEPPEGFGGMRGKGGRHGQKQNADSSSESTADA